MSVMPWSGRMVAIGVASALALATAACGGDDATTATPPDDSAVGTAAETLRVVANFYPLAEALQRVGGDRVVVTNLTPPGAEPHDIELTSDDVDAIEDADVVVYLGGGFQPGVDKAAERRSGATLDVATVVSLDAGHDDHDHDEADHDHDEADDHDHGDEADDHDHDEADHDHGDEADDHDHGDEADDHDHGDEADHDEADDHDHDEADHDHDDEADHDEADDHGDEAGHDGHDHGDLDPHFWLDPTLMQVAVRAIEAELAAASPADAATFAANAAAYDAELAALHAEFNAGLADCARDQIVTSHAAFAYLAHRYGLEQLAITGISPEAEPDPRRLDELIDLVQREGVTTIFSETLVSSDLAETLAREAGVSTAVLNPLEGLTAQQLADGETYASVQRANLAALQTALGCTPS